SPSVLFDSMEQRQSRGGRILFKIPHLPPLPVKNEGLSVEERAWLAQWIGDPKSRTKAAEKSRHFHHETLPKHASEIASGLLRSLEVHYGPLAIFHVFDGNDAARIIKQADFLVENIGDNPPREILDHLVSVGLEVKDLTEGDEELARTLARLSGFALRDRGALIGLGISRESMKRIEDFIRLSIPSNLRERYLIELPGKRIPALLFNLYRLISERRSELPDELAREIEMVLPERQSELGELRRRFAELALRYRKLPRELQKGQIKTHRQKIPKMIEKAELEGAGDLGMIEIRIEKLELELGIVEDELSADGEETGRRFGGIARSSEESRRGRNADAKANRVKETALIDSEETTSRQNEQAGAESAAANHASSAAVSRSALKAGR
ncbi:MAG TPA: hypothetical protein PLZ86_02165, partial [bacterium]|nr:hypothetical protein [bacterium]